MLKLTRYVTKQARALVLLVLVAVWGSEVSLRGSLSLIAEVLFMEELLGRA